MIKKFSWTWMWAPQNSCQRPTQWLESTLLGTDSLLHQGWHSILNPGLQRFVSRSLLYPLRTHRLQSSPKKTLEERNNIYSFLILYGTSPVPLCSRFPSGKHAPKDLVLNQPRISRKGMFRSSLAFPVNALLLIQLVYLVKQPKDNFSCFFFLIFIV